MKNLLFFFVLLAVSSLLMMCSEQEFNEKLIISDKNISKEDIKLKFVRGEGKLSNEYETIFLNYINEFFESNSVTTVKAETINSVKIENVLTPDIERKNLIFDLSSNSEEPVPLFAIVLTANSLKNGISTSFFSEVKHSCASAPCDCCTYVHHPGTNEILGCSCGLISVCPAKTGDRCSHTMTTIQK